MSSFFRKDREEASATMTLLGGVAERSNAVQARCPRLGGVVGDRAAWEAELVQPARREAPRSLAVVKRYQRSQPQRLVEAEVAALTRAELREDEVACFECPLELRPRVSVVCQRCAFLGRRQNGGYLAPKYTDRRMAREVSLA